MVYQTLRAGRPIYHAELVPVHYRIPAYALENLLEDISLGPKTRNSHDPPLMVEVGQDDE